MHFPKLDSSSARPFWSRLFVATALAVFTTGLVNSSAHAAGFSVSGGRLIDANGNNFVLRGVSHAHVWYTSQTNSAIPNIAATGANCVRVVLGNGVRWGPTPQSEVTNIISLCKTNRLIPILEVHDTTGWGEQSGAATLNQAVDYWISIQSALTGQEAYVIINIGNEPYGNNQPASTWVNGHANAIARLRNAGFTHTLMVDAANWGQDWENIMRNNANSVFTSDPQRNVVFSVHMYDVYTQDSLINAYLTTFTNAGLPIVVGEFAATHQPGQDVNEDAIMQRCQQYGLGYMGWSWSGNGSGLEALDMVVGFNPANRTTWGNRIITGANGLSTTSTICSVYTNTATLTVSPTSLAFAAAASSGTVAVTSNVSWTVTDNQSWLSVSPTSGANNGNITVSATANTGTASRSGTVTVTGGGLTRTVSVTQAAPSSNNLTVAPTSLAFASGASSSTVAVTSNVSWSVTDNQSWISVSPTSGSNNGNVTVSVTANTGTAARSGMVTVTGGGITRTVSVSQSAPSSNNLTLSTSSMSFGSAAGSNTFGITSNVSWTTSDNQSWITVTPASGSNNATATVNVTANTGTTARTGTITVAGGGITRTIAVSQSGTTGTTPCSNPTTITLNFAKDGAGEFCYFTTGTINFVNSWNLQTLEINGVVLTNVWVSPGSGNLPARINGGYYFRYVSNVAWGHLEINGTN